MQRNNRAIKAVLQHIEKSEESAVEQHEIIDSVTKAEKVGVEEATYHLELCIEGRLVSLTKSEQPKVRLTWKGHDTLDKLRRL